MALSEMNRHVHNIERIPRVELYGGPEGNIIPIVQEQKICSSRRHDCERDPLKQLRKAQVPKLHSHLAVLAPLFPKASAPERIGIYETSMRSESPVRSQRVKRHIDGTRFSSPECR